MSARVSGVRRVMNVERQQAGADLNDVQSPISHETRRIVQIVTQLYDFDESSAASEPGAFAARAHRTVRSPEAQAFPVQGRAKGRGCRCCAR